MKGRAPGTLAALAGLVALVAALDPAGGRGRLARGQDGGPVTSQTAPEAALSRQLARAVAAAAPWVVAVRGPGPLVPPRPANAPLPPRVRSGVVIAPGLVVTCASTIDVVGPDGVVVVDAAGHAFPARFRGRDLRLRVAILAADGLALPDAPPGVAPRRQVGSLALALGAPLRDLTIPTATLGIVSATGRFEGRAEQVDCPLDGSNVGGALADLEGRVVGVTVHVDARLGERSGVGFAVSLDRVRAVLDRLSAGDQLEPGLLGLVLPKDDEGDAGTGVPVRAVVPGSPAALAGLQADDRVVALHGRETPDRRTFREVVADLYAGQRVVVEARRGGEPAPRRFELVVAPRQ